MASQDSIARARSVPIEDVLAPRGHQLRRCGGELVGQCPICGGRDRFAVNPKKSVWHCRGCGKGGDGIALVRHLDGCGFNHAIEQLTGEKGAAFDPARRARARAKDTDHQRRQHGRAAYLWSQRPPIKGTIAEKYLRQARAISCSLPPTLAFLQPLKPEHHPALIAAFSLPDEPEPGVLGEPRNVESVHLTLLGSDGSGKAEVEFPKLFACSPGKLPIVIAPANDLLGLTITEGIEDALTAYQVTGRGAWAAGAAGRMPALAETLPEWMRLVTSTARVSPLQTAEFPWSSFDDRRPRDRGSTWRSSGRSQHDSLSGAQALAARPLTRGTAHPQRAGRICGLQPRR